MTRHAPARRPGSAAAPFDRPDRRSTRRFSSVLVVVVAAVAGLLFILTGVALAYFLTTDNSHPAEAVAAILAAPTGGAPTGTATPTAVPITWTVPSGYAPTGYTVLRCTKASCTNFTTIGNGGCSGTVRGTNCTDTDSGLAAGTTYTYEVEAQLDSWVSAPGSPFTASTPTVNLVFTQPTSGQSFQAKGTGTFNVSVSIQDANGNVATHDSSDTVTLAIASGHNPGGGTLNCNGTGTNGLTASASSGVASFTCAIDKAGNGYELTASSATSTSLTDPAPSNSFTITAGTPTTLVFTLPLSGQSFQAKGTGTFNVSVSIQDANGNVATGDSSDTVTLAIASGHNPGGGTLSCNGTGTNGLTATASSGVASFTCAITKVGSGYELTASSATSTSLTDPAPSNSFTITAGSPSQVIANSGGGQSATADAAFTNPLVATVEDANGNPVSGVSVTFACR